MSKKISNENEAYFAFCALHTLKMLENMVGECKSDRSTDFKHMIRRARKTARMRIRKYEGDNYVTEITIPFTGTYAKEGLKLFKSALKRIRQNTAKAYKDFTIMNVEENEDRAMSTHTLVYHLETPFLKALRALGYGKWVDSHIAKKASPKARHS